MEVKELTKNLLATMDLKLQNRKKVILATTSKNNNNTNLQNLDLDSIENIHRVKWEGYELHICIVVFQKYYIL